MNQQSPTKTIFKTKLYQNLSLNGRDLPAEEPKRKQSRFWNEGKWRNFVVPLLPKKPQDMTFVDVGTNAGLFLKLARDYGFRNAVGIERDRRTYEEGLKYRNAIGYDYHIINRTVSGQFSLDELPVADVTLLSNFHYHLKISDFLEYLDKLKTKTIYCLIVTSDHKSPIHHWRASGMIPDIRNYFKDWEEVGGIDRVSYTSRTSGDPVPRKLWSIMFKSRLKRVPIADIKWGAPGSNKEKDIHRDELANSVVKLGEKFSLTESSYYRAWKNRTNWPDAKIHQFVKEKVDTMMDIKTNGMKKPIWLYLDNKLIDGGHRIALMEAMGYKSIIARIV